MRQCEAQPIIDTDEGASWWEEANKRRRRVSGGMGRNGPSRGVGQGAAGPGSASGLRTPCRASTAGQAFFLSPPRGGGPPTTWLGVGPHPGIVYGQLTKSSPCFTPKPIPQIPGPVSWEPPPPDESGPGPTRPPPQGVFTVKESLGRGQRVNRVDGGKRRGVVAEEGQPRQREERVARGPRLSRTGGGPPPVAKGVMKLEKKNRPRPCTCNKNHAGGGGWPEKRAMVWQKRVGFGQTVVFWHPWTIAIPPKTSKMCISAFFF